MFFLILLLYLAIFIDYFFASDKILAIS